MKDKVRFSYDDNIINPCWDNVFKAVFAKETPESRGALQHLLSAILRRNLTVLSLVTTEPPVDSINERQIRYDIVCKFDSGELCNIEMTMNPDADEPVRLEYYSGKLFISQDLRGTEKTYSHLNHSYQIALLVNSKIYPDKVVAHNFIYYDVENCVSLNGRTHIVTIELSKLGQIAKKPVSEMTALERWLVFFKYTSNKKRRGLVNEIISAEEGIAMAGHVLLNISKDEKEWARLNSEYKYEVDFQSKMVGAELKGRRKGRREGIRKGKIEGRIEGEIKGRIEGEIKGEIKGRTEGAMETARNLLATSLSPGEIAKATGLSLEKVEELRANCLLS